MSGINLVLFNGLASPPWNSVAGFTVLWWLWELVLCERTQTTAVGIKSKFTMKSMDAIHGANRLYICRTLCRLSQTPERPDSAD